MCPMTGHLVVVTDNRWTMTRLDLGDEFNVARRTERKCLEKMGKPPISTRNNKKQ